MGAKSAAKTGAKARKLVPATFAEVVDSLLDVLMAYTPSPPPEAAPAAAGTTAAAPGAAAMDVDAAAGAAGAPAAAGGDAEANVDAAGAAGSDELSLSPLKVVQQLVAMPPERTRQVLALAMLAAYVKVCGHYE